MTSNNALLHVLIAHLIAHANWACSLLLIMFTVDSNTDETVELEDEEVL